MLYYILAVILCAAAGAYIWLYYFKKEEELLYTEEVTIMGKRTLRHYYRDCEIWEIFDFFSKEEAQQCIDNAEHSAKTAKLENKRENMIARLNNDLMKKIGKIISNLMNTPVEHKQQFGIYKYIPGAYIEGHYDGCSSKKDKACEELEVSNIIFLNDDYKGGEIYFRGLDLKIQPELGKMVMFKNYDNRGKLVTYSGFESMKIQNGMQYLLR